MSFYLIDLLEKKGDIKGAEEKIAEVSILKGELKFTVKGRGKYFVVVCRK